MASIRDQTNQLIISKTRYPALTQAVVRQPGEEVAQTLKAWMTDGTPSVIDDAQAKTLWALAQQQG